MTGRFHLMSYEYTPAVLRALEAAQVHARAAAASEVRLAHLLAALLEDDEARVAVLLTSVGLDLAAVRRSLTSTPSGEQPVGQPPLPLAQETMTVLRAAREPAAFLAPDHSIPSDAVLIALLRHDAILRQLLEESGLRYDELEQALFPMANEPLDFEEPEESPVPGREEVPQPAESSRGPHEASAVGRILDAAANRARDALRVLEDYCRFALDDRTLSGQLKQMRHDLAGVLSGLPAEMLLAGRDTPGDVGTDI